MKIIIDIDETAYIHYMEGTEDSRDEAEVSEAIKNAYAFGGIIEELEKIKDEIQDYEIMSVNGNSPENVFYIARDLFIRVIDKHIKELKGEQGV